MSDEQHTLATVNRWRAELGVKCTGLPWAEVRKSDHTDADQRLYMDLDDDTCWGCYETVLQRHGWDSGTVRFKVSNGKDFFRNPYRDGAVYTVRIER